MRIDLPLSPAGTSAGGACVPGAPAGSPPLETLCLRSVSAARGGQWLFGGLDLSLGPGERVWLKGANGSGKSTLLRIAAGLVAPLEGSVTWRGEAAVRSRALRAEAFFIGHQDGLKGALSATENLAFHATLNGGPTDRRSLEAALDAMGLDPDLHHRPVARLSQGQRRRVSLARLAGLARARVWILDEPCDALDVDGLARLDDLLEAHTGRGGSVLMTSHRPTAPGHRTPRVLDLDPLTRPPPLGHPEEHRPLDRRLSPTPARFGPRLDPVAAEGPAAPDADPPEPSALSGVLAILRRDLLVARRRRLEALQPLAFFVLAASLFPLAIGPEPQTLALVAPGVAWVCALLATLTSAQTLHESDHADGSLEQMLRSPLPALAVAGSRALSHLLVTGLPLTVAAPAVGALLGLGPAACGVLALTLLLGLPVVSLLGGLASALTLGLRQAGLLMLVIVLPLAVPVLVFASSAVSTVSSGLSAAPHLSLLAALLLLALPLAPWATAGALRLAME